MLIFSFFKNFNSNWIDWSGTDKLIIHSNIFSLLILYRFSWSQHPLFSKRFLVKYISDKDILSSNQSGFRKEHSCHTCLTNTVESLYSAMNDSDIIGSMELDFSKAFDILDVNIILRKLELYGCDPTSLRWFRSYLTARSQYVKMNDYKSNTGTLSYVLYVYVLYTNDMSLYIKIR